MSMIVAGVGRQPTVRSILPIGLNKVAMIHGQPLKMHATSRGIEFFAERVDYEKDFIRFTLRIDKEFPRATEARDAGQQAGAACACEEDDTHYGFVCPPENSEDRDAGFKALDAVCAKLSLPEIWKFEGSGYTNSPLSMELLFRAVVQYKASDLHLSPGRRPVFRVDNVPRTADIMGPVSGEQIHNLIKAIASEEVWEIFQHENQCSFTFHQVGLGFARVSAFVKSGAPHLTFRYLPEKVSSFDELGIPADVLQSLAGLRSGLIMIAGMGGTGKTTTAAAVIEYINANRSAHILTVEDPIEIVFTPKRAFISQRNLGEDVATYSEAVKGASRQDPDVLYIGEMRDAETIRAALNAAATGVLVVSTLNSANASGVVNRIVGFFEPTEREQIRSLLQDNLRAVICQKLVPKQGGGRIPALELLFNDIKPIRDAIDEGSSLKIRIGMQQTLSQSTLFEHYLHDLYKEKVITLETAKDYSQFLDTFEQIHMGTYKVPRLEH